MRACLYKQSGILGLVALLVTGCSGGKYEKLPKASEQVAQALTERYKALIDEAKTLKGKDPLALLHHFSHAALTAIQPAAFKQNAAKFIEAAAGGGYDDIDIRGARAPGKVRVLLVSTSKGKGAIPFVQSASGWKIDDVAVGFGDFEQELNLKGAMPESPPSVLASLAVLQDPQAGEIERVQAAIALAGTNEKATAEEFARQEKRPWAKTALLFAAWKNGGSCEPFAEAFPTDGEKQTELHDNDTDSFRRLLRGLFECAGISDSFEPVMKIYKGCYKVEGAPRSEYVDPLVGNPQASEDFMKTGLANIKPKLMLKACLRAGYKYEEDPAAHILVGGLHGEKDKKFHQVIHQMAEGRGRLARLAQQWVEKMAELDEKEPPGSETPPPP